MSFKLVGTVVYIYRSIRIKQSRLIDGVVFQEYKVAQAQVDYTASFVIIIISVKYSARGNA